MFLDLISDAKDVVAEFFKNLWPDALFTIHKILRTIIGFLDGLIYTADAELYDLIKKIADASIFSGEDITAIAGRIYQLIALIMMFRLIFIFINYIVNPDDIIDKKKGLGNVIKKMIITLILIVLTPWAFMQSRNIQHVIFKDRVIEYFVFGQTTDSNATDGYYLMHTVGKLFITPYQCITTTTASCSAVTTSGDLSNKTLCADTWDTDGSISDGGTCGYGSGNDRDFHNTLEKAAKPEGGKYDLRALAKLAEYGSNDRFTDSDTHTGWDSDFYVDYKYPLIGSTLVGIFLGYMLISICIDVAIRSVKLAFYEIISPIPIISNIGSKEGKDSMLNKWFSDVLKTYLDLFVRIAGIQLAMFFISMIMKSDAIKNITTVDDKFIVKLFLLLGALLFAKKLPEVLKNLGINFDTGGFSLKKKLEPVTKSLAKAARPVSGALAGAVGGAMANAQASKNVGRGLFKSGASTVGGALTGAVRGGFAGAKQKNGLGIGAGFGAAGKSGQKIVRNYGTTFGERVAARTQQKLGLDTEADKMQRKFENQDKWQKAREGMEEYAKKQVAKNPSFTAKGVKYTNAQGQTEYADVNLAQTRAKIDEMKAKGNADATALRQQRAEFDERKRRGFDNSKYAEERAKLTTGHSGLRNSADINQELAELNSTRTSVNENFDTSEFTNWRTRLGNERATLTNTMQQQQSELDARRTRGFAFDENVKQSVTYHSEVGGQDITANLSLGELRARRETAETNGWSNEAKESLDRAISSIENNQRTAWDNDTRMMENNLATTQSSLSRLDRDEQQLDRAEQDYVLEHQRELDTIASRERELQAEAERRKEYDDKLADIRRREKDEQRRYLESIAAEENRISAQEEAASHYEENLINLESQYAAAQKDAAYQWIEQNRNDAHIIGDFEEMNELERKLHMEISNSAANVKDNKDTIEHDTSRHEEEYRRALRTKEATKPKK